MVTKNGPLKVGLERTSTIKFCGPILLRAREAHVSLLTFLASDVFEKGGL